MMETLFPNSKAYILAMNDEHGFNKLMLPDGFRWISKRAICYLPTHTELKQPALMIHAMCGETRVLMVKLNGKYIGFNVIDQYGTYYFDLESRDINHAGEIKIELEVDDALLINGELLGVAIYGIDIIDLQSRSTGFSERDLISEQLRPFLENPLFLEHVPKDKLNEHGNILDIGAGIGWSTFLLGAYTEANIYTADIFKYIPTKGISFKNELTSRINRHCDFIAGHEGFASAALRAEQIIDRCHFISMNVQNLIYRDNMFDFIFSLNTFEHISGPIQALTEIRRVLKPGGIAFIQFQPLYYSDVGSHLQHLIDIPWVHLLYTRDKIKKLIRDSGKQPNEVDNILDSLNGWPISQFEKAFNTCGLKILQKFVSENFNISDSENSSQFRELLKIYELRDLITDGMTIVLRK